MLAAVQLKRRLRAPTSQSPLGATNGRVARELPFTPALLIRRVIASIDAIDELCLLLNTLAQVAPREHCWLRAAQCTFVQ